MLLFYQEERNKKSMFKLERLKRIDIWSVLIMCMLIAIGTVAISSATAYSGESNIVTKQVVFFIAGIVMMLVIMCIDYHLLGDWYLLIYTGTILALISVFIFGVERGGAERWIQIGPMQLQPSEFAKISMILCCAKLIAKYNEKINTLWPILLIGAFDFIPFILVNRQPNLSTSIVFIVILMIQLFVSKLKMKYIVTAMLVGFLITGSLFIYIIKDENQIILKPYQRLRILAKLNGDDAENRSTQTQKSKQAIGSGGLKGKGLYQGSISRLNYLPESQNDFIMAVIAEEFGFVGILTVVCLILLLIVRGLWIARAAPDDFGKLIVVGYIGMLAFQSFVNMGVASDLLPNTGLTIPFISSGGSSLWSNMMGMGLVLNVAATKEDTMF